MQHLLHKLTALNKAQNRRTYFKEKFQEYFQEQHLPPELLYQKYKAPFSCLHLVSFDILKGDWDTLMGTAIITQWLWVPYEQKLKNGWSILGHSE